MQKVKPIKKIPETDKIFENIKEVRENYGGKEGTVGMSGMIANQSSKTLGSIYQSYNEMGDDKLVMFIFVGFLIPIFEELLYRGLAYNLLKERMNYKIAIVIQAVLFLVFEVLSGGLMNLASLIIISFIPEKIFLNNRYVFMIISAVLCVVTFIAVMKAKKENVKLLIW